MDRHEANLFYQFDENGKLVGIQGIDNDCALGLLTPDEDFKKYKPADLEDVNPNGFIKGQNLFGTVGEAVREFKERAIGCEKEFRSMNNLKAIGKDNRALPGGTDKEIEKGGELLQGMKDVTITGWWKWHHGTSKQFEAMREAVRKYREYQQEVADRVKQAQLLQKNHPDLQAEAYGVIREEEIEKMASLAAEAGRCADVYLQGKYGKKNNVYTRSRMAVAETVREFGNLAKQIRPEEKEFSKINTRQLKERINRAKADDPMLDIKFEIPKPEGPAAGK